MKAYVKAGLAFGASALVLACSATSRPLEEPAGALSPDPGSSNVQLYDVAVVGGVNHIIKFCDGPNAVYILERYHGIAVSPNDPFCTKETR